MKNIKRYVPRYSVLVNRDCYDNLRSEYARRLNAYKQRIESYQNRVEKLREKHEEQKERVD